MCRLLCVRSKHRFDMRPHLETLAEISRNSREYQGHGWGCAWLEAGEWRIYRNINPIWDDREAVYGVTTLMLAHARSAFRNEGIRVENNMPFVDGEHAFVFNGELQGVRIREQGRIGAEKIFNYVKRFDRGDMLQALSRGMANIGKRTRYVRAINIVLASRKDVYFASQFNEDPEYFQMQTHRSEDVEIVCSERYPGGNDWLPVTNGTIDIL
jgi:predicted glutamine amidotransferase